MGWVTGKSQCQGIICTQAESRPQASPLQPLFSPFPQDQAFGQVVASPDGPALIPHPLSCFPPVQPPWTERGWFGLYKQHSTHRPAPSTQPQPTLLHTLSTSKPRSAQADDVERPRNATNIARPPGIQELVINSPPKPGFAPLTGFSIQNSSRLCHLPAFCRHGTLSCSLGAIQPSRTVWREKHHCEASQDSQGTQHQESPCHPLPRGSHQAGGYQEVPSAPRRGTNEGHTAPGWAAAAGEMALCTGTALACSPPA